MMCIFNLGPSYMRSTASMATICPIEGATARASTRRWCDFSPFSHMIKWHETLFKAAEGH